MRIIAFADLHSDCTDLIYHVDFSKYGYDFCFTLGDINCQHLQAITECVNCPVYGVLGNHDDYGMLERFGIIQLDSKLENLNNVTVTGFSGSSRYKNDDKPMLTQKESLGLSKQLPHADILVSHDSAYGLYGAKSDDAHCGLKGITRYVKKHKPFINIHGHHHVNRVQIYKGTIDICVFGGSVIEIEKNSISEIRKIF